MFKNLSNTSANSDKGDDGWSDILLEDCEDQTIEVQAELQQQHSNINNLNNLVGGGGGGSSSGLRRRKPNSDAEFYPSTSNEKPNSVYLPALNLGMMMVSRVQQAFAASSSSSSPSTSTKCDVQQLQQQLDQLHKQYTELGNQYQQVQGLAVYYQNLHQCGEKQLQEALLRHNVERKGLDEQIKKAADERDNLEAKYEEEMRNKLAAESELKNARHLIECFKGRQRSSSIDSLDTESSFSSELARANEMVDVLRSQLKKSEEQLAVRSVTSDDLFDDVHLNQEEKLQHLQEFVEKLKCSRRRKVDQIVQLCEALNVAGANCDELRENLMRTRDSNKQKKAKIDQLTSESEQLRRQLERLQAEIDEKNAEIESGSVAWQQRIDALELEHESTERAMRELHTIELSEMDVKLKEIALENTKIVERELHLSDERNATCDRLRDALESLEKLEVECTSTCDENATLRDELERYEAVRHEEASAMQSELSKCESQLMQNQHTISRLRDKNLQLLDQIDQEQRARERHEAEIVETRDSFARKSAADETAIGELRAESRRASVVANTQLDELKLRVSSLEADLSRRDDVIKEMKTRFDEQGRYAAWCEDRMRHFEGVCSRLHEDACRFYHDARKHFDAAVSLQRDNDQLRGWYHQQHRHHHHHSGRLFESEKSERLDRILEDIEPTTPVAVSPGPTDAFCPGQSSTPLAKPSPAPHPGQQSKKLFTTLKLEPAPEVEKLSKRELRVAQLRKLPIWRRENPDNWNADLSYCEVSDDTGNSCSVTSSQTDDDDDC